MLFASPVGPVLTVGTGLISGRKTDRPEARQRGMSTSQTRSPAPCRRDGPPADVIAWRRCRLLEAGFSASLATALACQPGVDVHELLQLVDRGCPPALAARILSPLPGPA